MASDCIILSFPGGEVIEPPNAGGLPEEFFEPEEYVDASREEHKRRVLEKIDALRKLVEQGRVEGLVLLGQDPMTGYFLTELCLDPEMNRAELFGFLGVLDTLKLEITEMAAMAPTITLTGAVLDPYEEME